MPQTAAGSVRPFCRADSCVQGQKTQTTSVIVSNSWEFPWGWINRSRGYGSRNSRPMSGMGRNGNIRPTVCRNSRLRRRHSVLNSDEIVFRITGQLVSAQKIWLKLLHRHRKLFNDLENNLMHRHWTVYAVCIVFARSAWSPLNRVCWFYFGLRREGMVTGMGLQTWSGMGMKLLLLLLCSV